MDKAGNFELHVKSLTDVQLLEEARRYNCDGRYGADERPDRVQSEPRA